MTKDTFQSKVSEARRAVGKDFKAFRACYFPHYNKYPNAPFHDDLCKLLSNMTEKRGLKLALAAPRGSAKSTIITLQYVLYCICYKLDIFILLLSGTASQSEGYLNEIKNELQTNQLLAEDFPDVCEIGTKPRPPRWRQNEIITRNGVKVLALSSGQQVRGRRHKESRLTLIIQDDLETDEQMQTSEQFEKLQNWLTKAVLKGGTARTNVIFTGTIHHYGSLLAQYVDPKVNPGWIKRVYKAVISWSKQSQLWVKWERIYNSFDSYEDREGPEAARAYFEQNKEKMLEGTKVLWPEFKNYYELMVIREDEGHYAFDSEMMNEPVNPKDCLFNVKEDLHFWDDGYQSEEELFNAIGHNKSFFGACDPSLGKDTSGGDPSAIITVVRDNDSGKIYILDVDVERRRPDKIIDDVLAHYEYRQYLSFAFETNQFQDLIRTQLEEKGSAMGIYPTIVPINNYSDKVLRIQSLQPYIKNGKIQFSRKHRELLEEMRCFPKGVHDDAIDTLEMVFRVCKIFHTDIGMPVVTKQPLPIPDVLKGAPNPHEQLGILGMPRNDRRKDRFVPDPNEW